MTKKKIEDYPTPEQMENNKEYYQLSAYKKWGTDLHALATEMEQKIDEMATRTVRIIDEKHEQLQASKSRVKELESALQEISMFGESEPNTQAKIALAALAKKEKE
jgi:hypothetical protein